MIGEEGMIQVSWRYIGEIDEVGEVGEVAEIDEVGEVGKEDIGEVGIIHVLSLHLLFNDDDFASNSVSLSLSEVCKLDIDKHSMHSPVL